MKKILTLFLTFAMLFTFCVVPASAAVSKGDFDKMTGPGKLTLDESGARVDFEEGLTFYKYTAKAVNVKEFTCKFKLTYSDTIRNYFSITLMNGKGYSGKQGLFLLFRIVDDNTLEVEGQIINTGFLLTDPRATNVSVNCKGEIVMKGKDNGNGTYTISFEGGTGEYTFNIPENYKFTEDLNGEGYLTFGGTTGGDNTPRAITIISYNDIDFTDNTPTSASSSSGSSSNNSSQEDENTIIIGGSSETEGESDADTEVDTKVEDKAAVSDSENEGSILTVVIIICACVAVLGIGGAVAAVLIVKKKNAAGAENEAEAEGDSAQADE